MGDSSSGELTAAAATTTLASTTTTTTTTTTTKTKTKTATPQPSIAAEVDVEALDALAAALTTDHGAVDVCRRAAGFLLAHVPGAVAVQIAMHGATADAPPQVFTFPRRPPNADDAKEESSEENSSADERATAAEGAAKPPPSSTSTPLDLNKGNSGDDTSLAAVSGSHAGSDRAVSWSVADAAAVAGPSSSSSPPPPAPTPPYSDWRSLADSHAATAFLTVPASVSGRPRASLTVAGTSRAFPSRAAALEAVAATASAVAALLAPYLALAAVRRQLDVAQALLADVMPHSVMAGVVERRALGLAPAMFGGGGGGNGGGGNGGNGNDGGEGRAE